MARLFGATTAFLGGAIQVIVVAFLVLATGDLFRRKVAAALPQPTTGSREDVVEEAEGVVRHYLLVNVLINAGQGVAVGLAMLLIGMPHPLLWGLLTFALEFLPYIGGVVMMAALALVGFATSGGIGRALLAPGLYLVISTIRNNVVSPFAYGHRLQVNPVAVLLGVLVGWFLWGVAGAFVPVPVLAATKIVADRSRHWTWLGEALGE